MVHKNQHIHVHLIQNYHVVKTMDTIMIVIQVQKVVLLNFVVMMKHVHNLDLHNKMIYALKSVVNYVLINNN
jgi:hypothetical protein